jgi:hypothetical protein
VILSPVDFRRLDKIDLPAGLPAWVPELHAEIKAELARYR